ncbi:Eco57I restriction-modification methylase domain-containing protein [Arthrobacter sp. NPDC055138]
MSGAFQAITVVGGVLPPSLLGRIQSGNLQDKGGLAPSSYFLAGRETISDAASRSWAYLKDVWQDWQEADRKQGGTGAGTGDARQRWLLILLRELGYGQVARAGTAIPDRESFPVSHLWDNVPIHLLGPRVELDRRNPGIEGAVKAPQKMLQEFLNHRTEYLWGILSNGLKLRILRDSTALAGSAYVEFDLETIFTSELYPEFQLFWQLCHQSRLAAKNEQAGPASCWLESWRSEAVESGSRALERLGEGVQQALEQLGTGLLRHPNNAWLIEALHSEELTRHDYHKALLRTAYRLLFCFVVEDRGALHTPGAPQEVRRRYSDFFSTRRLRKLSRKHDGGPHDDLWRSQKLVLQSLGGNGLDALGLPALGGLFDPDPRAKLAAGQPGKDLVMDCELANQDLLRTVRSLAWVKNASFRVEAVDYRHLGAEELGSVYESLLELIPRVDLESKTFELENVAGNERKVTGSYYTPPGLVSALLDTALEPILDEALEKAADSQDAERRLLALTVCDPASGSGGFLVAAARRIARRLAEVRAGEDEPTPENIHHALHDVVDRCIYGVDMNDLAAELTKVSLWLEAVEPGKPLNFLDSRIKIGNSLFGSTPALLDSGIPDEAFDPVEGDDRKYSTDVKKANRQSKKASVGKYISPAGMTPLEFDSDNVFQDLVKDRLRLNSPVTSVQEARSRAVDYAKFNESRLVEDLRRTADTWCASFAWHLERSSDAPPPTNGVFRRIKDGHTDKSLQNTIDEVNSLKQDFRFFHWHLEFPEIFMPTNDAAESHNPPPKDGFTCMLGNPPWGKIKLEEKNFFRSRMPEVAETGNKSKRAELINALALNDPILYNEYKREKRARDQLSKFLHKSSAYPLCGIGEINTYSVFAERFRQLTSSSGRFGVIIPTGIATDDTTKRFFASLVEARSLAALHDFENSKPLFTNVHRSYKFSLLTVLGERQNSERTEFSFFLKEPSQIGSSTVDLPADIILSLNPNTNTLPIFRNGTEAEITAAIYRACVPLINEAPHRANNPWGVSLHRMFDISSDSHLFRTQEDLDGEGWTLHGDIYNPPQSVTGGESMLPLYQGAMIHLYNNRFASGVRNGDFERTELHQLRDFRYAPMPKTWVPRSAFAKKWPHTNNGSLFVFRNVARSTDTYSFVGTNIPFRPAGNSAQVMSTRTAGDAAILQALTSSATFAYAAKRKIGGANVNFFHVKQLPILPPEMIDSPAPWNKTLTCREWLTPRIIELSYTNTLMSDFALALGDVLPPFVFDPNRRFLLRAEIEAALMHLHELDRNSALVILEDIGGSFWSAGDFDDWDSHIMHCFDEVGRAIETGQPYRTALFPPPGEGPRHSQSGVGI